MHEEITLDDLDLIYVVIEPEDGGPDRVNMTIRQMSDKLFRRWIKGKAEMHGVKMNVPVGRIGYETRVYMLNRLVQSGVRIYKVPRNSPLILPPK